MLADGEGNPSTMRSMSFLSLIAGIVIAGVGIGLKKDLSALAILCGVFVGGAFGGKAIQSSIENRQ